MRRRTPLGLWAYLVVTVGATVVAALVAYGSLSAFQRVAEAEARTLADARDLARSVGATAAHFLIVGAYDGLEQTLVRLATLARTQRIEVFDADGGLVSAVVNERGAIRPSFARRSFRAADEPTQSLEGGRLTIVVPIERGAAIGWVRTVSSLEELRGIRSRIWFEAAGAALVTVIAVAAILAWSLRRAVQPLGRATAFAGSLEQRHGQQLEPAGAVREIDGLTAALNRLSTTLHGQDAALQAVKRRESAILEAALDCLITIDAEGRIVDFNPAAERTFGYARTEAVGRMLGDLIVPPSLRAAHAAGMARHRATGEGPVLRQRLELTAMRRDGQEFPAEIAIVPFEVGGETFFAGYVRDISEQKALELRRARTEADLRTQTERLQIGQAAARLLILDWDIARDELVWSGAPEWLRGPVPADTGTYPPFKDQVHPDDREGFLAMRARAIATLEGQEREYRVVRTDGVVCWVDSRQIVFPGPDGKAARMLVALHDITERKIAEQNLAQARDRALSAEATLSAAIENVTQGIIMLDAEDRMVLANSRARELLGVPPEYATPGRRARDAVEWLIEHGEFAAGPAGQDELYALATSRATDLEGYERTRPNGTVLEIRSTRLPDGRFVRTFTDVTERKRIYGLLEQSLRELEGQKFALDQHAIVSVTDPEGRITYANDKFVQVSGYRREELLGATHRLIRSGRHDPAFYREMWDTIRAGRTWHGEILNRSKDGAPYWVASTIVPLLDERGQPRQYIAIRTDITQQKLAESALSEARARELETGHAIQQALLLSAPPALAELEIAAYAQPSQGVDGDFYEFFAVHGRCCDVLLGDVMGKGVTAALMGAGVKSQYGRILADLMAPGRLSGELPQVRSIVDHLHARLAADLIRLDAFVTIAYCRIDLALQRLSYVGAGHPPALLLSAAGELALIHSANLPIGVRRDERYAESQHPFDPGDLLLLYSDGVTDARSLQGEEFGLDRLARRVRELCAHGVPPAMLVECVRRAVAHFAGASEWRDDFTIVAIAHRAPDHRLHTREFPRDLAELGRLRAWVGDLSAAHLAEEAVHRLQLAAVEIASNIVRHADAPVRAAAYLCHHEVEAAAVRLDFYYLGTPYDRAQVAPPDFSGAREGGFGLYIVEHSVDEFAQTVLAGEVNRLTLRMFRRSEAGGPLR